MAYGQVSADVINTSVSGVSLGAGNASIMKNRLINGNMAISQRNGTTATNVTTNAQYTLDRWTSEVSQSSKFTVTQSTTAPTGFNNSALITSSSAYTVGASEIFTFEQRIEAYNTADLGFGTANAKTVTLSFWVQSSLTGTFGGALQSYISNRSYPFSYTISSANTWQQVSITIAGDTTGSWSGASNSGGIVVLFSLGAGASVSGTAGSWSGTQYFSATGATSVVGTSGATFYITGVQLEVGSSATGYEYRQYGQELALCQRYCFAYTDSTSAGNASYGVGNVFNASNINICGFFPVSMRIAPTGITVTSPTSFFIGTGGSNTTTSSISYGGASTSSYQLSCAATGVTSGTVILLNNSRGGQLLWSAEL
jgi:hypothetical protein